jgi:hypothetical protein
MISSEQQTATQDGRIWPIARWQMKEPHAIVARMAEDLSRFGPTDWCERDLFDLGWGSSQIGCHIVEAGAAAQKLRAASAQAVGARLSPAEIAGEVVGLLGFVATVGAIIVLCSAFDPQPAMAATIDPPGLSPFQAGPLAWSACAPVIVAVGLLTFVCVRELLVERRKRRAIRQAAVEADLDTHSIGAPSDDAIVSIFGKRGSR